MGTPAALTTPRIFVSYNRQDVVFTRRLVASLERAGAVVWVDWEGARDGDFLKRINQGLVKCDWLALVETPHSLASDPVEMEVNAALNRVLYGQMRGVVRLIASPRDPRSVPPTWATLQYYDATSDYDDAVAALLERAVTLADDPAERLDILPEYVGG
ncbi:MAG TPA: toll/interleukin-1 receptor domain-containing protein [Ktedonobacterales bacterium]